MASASTDGLGLLCGFYRSLPFQLKKASKNSSNKTAHGGYDYNPNDFFVHGLFNPIFVPLLDRLNLSEHCLAQTMWGSLSCLVSSAILNAA